jgi:hypothetical protein
MLHTGMRKAQSGLLAQNGGPPLGVLRLAGSVACVGAALVALVTLVGWLAGFPLVTTWGGLATMKPVTALAALLIASAILPQLPLGPAW